jgi:hypothetical protein
MVSRKGGLTFVGWVMSAGNNKFALPTTAIQSDDLFLIKFTSISNLSDLNWLSFDLI